MAQRIKYKVISYSSEQRQFPVSSLLVPGSDGWQTKRFCNYPQQVTLQFYGITHIDKIQILADSRKIASVVDILYYDPNQNNAESRFVKYGTLEFSKNESGRIHQQKTVMVDMKCLYLRFLFHRPYKNRQNFFSQVHIHQLAIYGGESNMIIPLQTAMNKKNSYANINIDPKSISEQQDEFVYQKLIQIQRRKQQAVNNEDFDEAQRLKQIMMNVKKFGYKLKSLKDKKNQAAQKQDYQLARSIKQEIDRLKKQVDMLVTQTLQGDGEQQYDERDKYPQHQMQHDTQGNQFVGLQIDKMLDRQQNQSRVTVNNKNSRVKFNASNVAGKKTDRNHNMQSSYDERVIPTLLNKSKANLNNEFQNQEEIKAQQIGPAQQIDGSHAADASTMMEFFTQQTVKQYFSKHWQHKQKSLTDILNQINKKQAEPTFIKCLLRIAAQSISQTNFKISQLSLNLLLQVLKLNAKSTKLSKNTVQQRDLQKIMDEVIKKMADNNVKIRNSTQQIFQQMLQSSLFGVEYCCSSLMKSSANVKGSVKQETLRLSSLTNIVNKFGLGENGVHTTIVQFAVEKLANPAAEIRNQAINLLAICANKDQKLVSSRLQGKKAIYMQQIEAKQKQLQTKSPNTHTNNKKK